METYSPSASKASFPGPQRPKQIKTKKLRAAGGRHRHTASEEPSYKCQEVTPPSTILQETTKASALGRGSWPEMQIHAGLGHIHRYAHSVHSGSRYKLEKCLSYNNKGRPGAEDTTGFLSRNP